MNQQLLELELKEKSLLTEMALAQDRKAHFEESLSLLIAMLSEVKSTPKLYADLKQEVSAAQKEIKNIKRRYKTHLSKKNRTEWSLTKEFKNQKTMIRCEPNESITRLVAAKPYALNGVSRRIASEK